MKIGTKSLLFGAHAFWLHPWFVAAAWWKLYGFPWDLRIWVAFVIHDWGYWGLDAMDDEQGEWHPAFGADIMLKLFGSTRMQDPRWHSSINTWTPYCLVFYHSRFLAQRYGFPPSPLCYADKYSLCLIPWWLYVPMVRLTGEILGYKQDSKHIKDLGHHHQGDPTGHSWKEDIAWFKALQNRMREYAGKSES
jgi:hypothetical protein